MAIFRVISKFKVIFEFLGRYFLKIPNLKKFSGQSSRYSIFSAVLLFIFFAFSSGRLPQAPILVTSFFVQPPVPPSRQTPPPFHPTQTCPIRSISVRFRSVSGPFRTNSVCFGRLLASLGEFGGGGVGGGVGRGGSIWEKAYHYPIFRGERERSSAFFAFSPNLKCKMRKIRPTGLISVSSKRCSPLKVFRAFLTHL